MALSRRLAAEFVGTFVLVLLGCGSAVLAANTTGGGIGALGVALAFGLAVLVMAYAVGHISGGHFNPAVTVGLWLGRRIAGRDVLPYIGSQLVGAVAAAALLFAIASGRAGFSASESGFAANGFGEHSPEGYGLASALLAEVVMTLIFLVVILGATDRRAPKGMGPLAIGLSLTLIHLMTIPVTNTSVNPARSTGPALFVGDWALAQLWLFWLAPILGAAIAGAGYRYLVGDTGTEPLATEAQPTGEANVAVGELGGQQAATERKEHERASSADQAKTRAGRTGRTP